MRTFVVAAVAILPSMAIGAEGEISPDRGRYVSIIGGCHDCHSQGYSQSGGVINPDTALMGSSVGWKGPWGTTYAANLRVRADKLTEDGFTTYLQVLKTEPPMPWFNVRALPESDIRSLYRYIKSLGPPGKPAPEFVAADAPPRTPYVVLAPPQAPTCSRDLDCGVGEICSTTVPRMCVKQ